MAVTIYGAQLFKSPTREWNYDGGKVIGTNSAQFTSGDPVTITSGFLAVAGANSTVYGIVVSSQTMISNNQTVAMVKPYVTPIDQDYEYLMGTNSDLANTSVGTYYQLTGTTGVVLVDVSTGAVTGVSRVVICTAVDPNGLGGTGSGSGARQGLFKFVKVTNVRSNT